MPMNNYSPELKRILDIAAIEARRDQTGIVTTHHVLCAMVMDGLNTGADLFQQQGLTLQDLRSLDYTKKIPATV
jgi:ATP-dependent Clp protease ATP-binding subunit ClpA